MYGFLRITRFAGRFTPAANVDVQQITWESVMGLLLLYVVGIKGQKCKKMQSLLSDTTVIFGKNKGRFHLNHYEY